MPDDHNDQWLSRWIDSVARGAATMSQRAVSSVDAHGGIDQAVTLAQARGVHLVQLTDDTGKLLLAASRHPFKTLC